jgi:acetyltransferase-like isoleucine patch superfamily enzyme
MLERFVSAIVVGLGVRLERASSRIAQKTMPAFANDPEDLTIELPRRIKNPERIFIGDHVKLGPNCVLSAATRYPGPWLRHPEGRHVEQTFEPILRIGHRVTATGALRVFALRQIMIEDDVMFASNIFLCDALHAYRNPHEPYKYQGMEAPDPIVVERGCWIGENVVILPGVTIGECSVIGANSVVTRSVPARSIAAGVPAEVMKRWDDDAKTWAAAPGDSE